MSNKNEQVYPTHEVRGLDGGGILAPSYGLTKRELIAAMAMQGLLTNEANDQFKLDFDTANQWYDAVGEASVKMADALLEALK